MFPSLCPPLFIYFCIQTSICPTMQYILSPHNSKMVCRSLENIVFKARSQKHRTVELKKILRLIYPNLFFINDYPESQEIRQFT